jgi:hypothetical protein
MFVVLGQRTAADFDCVLDFITVLGSGGARILVQRGQNLKIKLNKN